MGAFLALALTILSQTVADPLAALDTAVTAAENALRDGKLQVAESRYQSVLRQAWTMAGALDVIEQRDAGDAFRHASTAAAETGAPIEPPPSALLAKLQPAERLEIRRRLTDALARAYLNLGVMQAQAGRYARAAELLEDAAHVDAAFPQVQYSLGVAYFNAQRYTQAVAPLSRALDASPDNVILRRMLAIACLNTDAYEKAAALLASDRGRDADPSLQYAYGLALVRSDHAAEAESIFSRLLTEHADTPELSVVLGHAYAQQGNYDAAIDALRRALRLRHDVADANSALGVIYLKQGKFPEAEAALRAELQSHPGDVKARETLATALDLLGRQDDALGELRTVLESRPEFAAARYLTGKILLSRGAQAEAATHLEIAARLAPDDANIHFQLARAYEQLGRAELARQEFATYQQLKEKQRRGKTP
jgi:Flp pilus assembly protein TadD